MKKIFILTMVVVGLFSSCYKDNNNYMQQEVNTLKIETDAENYQVEQTKVLKIEPKLSPTLDASATYDYEWKLLSDANEILLSTSQVLEKQIDVVPGSYTLLFTAIDQKNKVRSYKSIPLTVNSTLYSGYYVAYNTNGKGNLGFIRQDGEIFYEVEKKFSKMEWSSKLLKVYTAICKKLRLVFVATEDNIYRLHGDNLSLNGNIDNIFPAKIAVASDFYSGMNFYSGVQYPTDIFLINGGKPYANVGPDFGGSSSVYSAALSYERDYDIFPFISTGGSAASIFYDNKNKKFLRMAYSSRVLLNIVNDPANHFDPTQVGKTAIAAINGQNNDVSYIMKDPVTGGYSIYTVAQYVEAIAKGMRDVNLQQAIDFDKAKYYSGLTDRPYFYYGTENKIYLFDLRTFSAKVVLQLAADERIADIQVHHKLAWETKEQAEYNKQIVIAVNKSEKGEVRFYAITGDGMLSAQPGKVYKGFGNIVDIDYRNPNN